MTPEVTASANTVGPVLRRPRNQKKHRHLRILGSLIRTRERNLRKTAMVKIQRKRMQQMKARILKMVPQKKMEIPVPMVRRNKENLVKKIRMIPMSSLTIRIQKKTNLTRALKMERKRSQKERKTAEKMLIRPRRIQTRTMMRKMRLQTT